AVHETEDSTGDQQTWHTAAAPPAAGVRCIAQLNVVYVVGVIAANILLGDQAGCLEWRRVVRIGGWKESRHVRQRHGVPAPLLATTCLLADYDQCLAALPEVARILGLLGNLPHAGQTDSIWMDQPTIAFSVRPPTQIGAGINDACAGLTKQVVTAHG